MIKALVRSLFYLRSIAKELHEIRILYALELEHQGIQITNPNAPNSEVEILYGPKEPDPRYN